MLEKSKDYAVNDHRDASPMPSSAVASPAAPQVSSVSASLSIVGKIIGHGAVTIFGHVEGELRASTVVIAEGAQMEGDVVAEELTIGGHVKGTLHANRVRLNSTAVVEGDISIEHWRWTRMRDSREHRGETKIGSTRRRAFKQTATSPRPG